MTRFLGVPYAAAPFGEDRLAPLRPARPWDGVRDATAYGATVDTVHVDQSHPLIGDTPSREVADTAHGTWVRFISTGDPGWAPYTAERRTTGVLTERLTVVDDPDGEERAAWEGIR